MMQQQQRTIIRMKYTENSIVFKNKLQSTSNNMAAAVFWNKAGCRRWQQRQNKVEQQQESSSSRDLSKKVASRSQLKQRSIPTQVDTVSSDAATTTTITNNNNDNNIHDNKNTRIRLQRTRHQKTLTEYTTRIIDYDFDTIFDGSFSSTNGGGGAFAEFIFDGDSEDGLNDQHETSYWEGCQGS
jgi:hypothetical protein